MVRVNHPKPGKTAGRFDGLRGAKVSKQRNRHKVVFEDADQKKQKSLYFRSDPPPGYTFIPAGNPQLTEALKEFAKKSNREIFAVTTTPHASRHELSREVHRIGWHFPTEVVARVCSYYGIRLTASGKLVEDKDDDKLFMKVYQKGQLVLDEKVLDQVTINTEAKQIIKDLFPNIPDNDLFKIIKTAFQVGDGKVGTADEIPLVRRAQLSVVAHIRHTYTNYDKLLRQVPYSEARHNVESETLKKLIEWRGDDDNKDAVEDTLREVVVISDEEESDDDIEDGQILANEDVRIQVVSSAARHDHVGTHLHNPEDHYFSDDTPGAYRYVPQVVRRIPLRSQPELIAAQQRSRYAVWDRYRQEHRAAVAQQPPRVIERILIEDPTDQRPVIPVAVRNPFREVPRIMEPPIQRNGLPDSPTFIRAADGRLYERVVVSSDDANGSNSARHTYAAPSTAAPHVQYTRSRPLSPQPYQARALKHGRTISFDEGDASVMPSIESANEGYQSSPAKQHQYNTTPRITQKRHSDTYYIQSSDNASFDDLRNMQHDLKRQRNAVTPPSPFLQRHTDHGNAANRPSMKQKNMVARDEEYVMGQNNNGYKMTVDSPQRPLPRGANYDSRTVLPEPLRYSAAEGRGYITHAALNARNESSIRVPYQSDNVPYTPQLRSGDQVQYIQLDGQVAQSPSSHYSVTRSHRTEQIRPTDPYRRVSGQDRDLQRLPQPTVVYESTMHRPQPNPFYQ